MALTTSAQVRFQATRLELVAGRFGSGSAWSSAVAEVGYASASGRPHVHWR